MVDDTKMYKAKRKNRTSKCSSSPFSALPSISPPPSTPKPNKATQPTRPSRTLKKSNHIRRMRLKNLKHKSHTTSLYQAILGLPCLQNTSKSGRCAAENTGSKYRKKRRRSRKSAVTIDKRKFQALQLSGKIMWLGESTGEFDRVAKDLLALKADPNRRDPDGISAMTVALLLKKSEQLVQTLLDGKGSPNLDFRGKSMVDIALEVGNAPVLRLLLQRGGLPLAVAKSSSNSIPLFASLYNFSPEATLALQNALWNCLSPGNICSIESVDSICSHLKNVDFVDMKGRSPLFCALRTGRSARIIQTLLNKKADPNLRDGNDTPLCTSLLLKGHRDETTEILSLLLDHGLNLDAKMGEDDQQTIREFAQLVAPRLTEKFKSRLSFIGTSDPELRRPV
ncbi:hypothetical protein AAMO2058_000044900 [Amorphochlora amoebiformis]